MIWARPPSAAQTANTKKKRPSVFAVNVGQSFEPTTLRSVRPRPANCVCFWRTSIARWTVSSPTMTAGTISTWITNRRGMMSLLGNSPPNTRKALHGPMNGIERSTEYAMRSPVPESRSSGRL